MNTYESLTVIAMYASLALQVAAAAKKKRDANTSTDIGVSKEESLRHKNHQKTQG
ncbi:hypothetical protein [Bacillus inaquosorum]|uniref:hypothetical protein n=1 Tax=Bacillus subtilis group TaxID=653685 RepID=UPI00227F2E38|nr:hypothetical protein [Bacillus inaquosorum]MCY8995796.1 hypothetical protein [Bacillus inaquosorum]MED4612127.1 hypothetical protein [Bacillus subtilis]